MGVFWGIYRTSHVVWVVLKGFWTLMSILGSSLFSEAFWGLLEHSHRFWLVLKGCLKFGSILWRSVQFWGILRRSKFSELFGKVAELFESFSDVQRHQRLCEELSWVLSWCDRFLNILRFTGRCGVLRVILIPSEMFYTVPEGSEPFSDVLGSAEVFWCFVMDCERFLNVLRRSWTFCNRLRYFEPFWYKLISSNRLLKVQNYRLTFWCVLEHSEVF